MFARFIARYPKLVIIIVVSSLIISGYYASQIKIGVNSGRFELKNSVYQTYKKILHTFGSESDNVIIVSVSKNGNIFNLSDMQNILRLEMAIDKNISVENIDSIVDYVMAGIHISNMIDRLPHNINISLDPRIEEDISKMDNAIANYNFIEKNANNSTQNDAYRIYILLPVYFNYFYMPSNKSGNGSIFSNFTYPYILKNSLYRETPYNATNMLIEEIEIAQNLSRYHIENRSMGFKIPRQYSLGFVNKSIENTNFSITYDKIGMENYNRTYIEWYAYNLSFNLALSLLYSGYREIALNSYRFDRSTMLNASAQYERDNHNWTTYLKNLTVFMNNSKYVHVIINNTEQMVNRTFGTLRDYLISYLSNLQRFANYSVPFNFIQQQTLRTVNISNLMLNYTAYSYGLDIKTLPCLNTTIADVNNNSGDYSNAIKLAHSAQSNEIQIMDKVAYFYGDEVIMKKVLIILKNLKSILTRNESSEIKESAWNLLHFSPAMDSTHSQHVNLTPFHNALVSYRNTINTSYYRNTTLILWDYLTLQDFTMDYSSNYSIDFNMNYSRENMLKSSENMTQSELNSGISKIRSFRNESVESLISNYTTALNSTRVKLYNISSNLRYISLKYENLGKSSVNFTMALNNFSNQAQNATKKVNSSEQKVYSLRLSEDFFAHRNMYFNTMLSGDELSTILIVSIYNSSYETNIYNIVENHGKNSYVSYHTISSTVLVNQIEKAATRDMKTFLPLSLLLILLLLFITYRTLKAVFLSMSAVLIALIWLFAFAALIGWDFDPILLAVPIMMIGIGIDDGIYVTLRYMEERQHKTRKTATLITVASVGGALILTTLTSMVGFLSNAISSMEDIQRFGVLAAMGMIFSFIAMNTFLPAANMVLDTHGKRKFVHLKTARIGADIAVRNPYVAIIIVVILASAGILSLSHLNTEFNMQDLAPANSDIVTYYHYYEKNFNASVEISYIYIEGNLSSPKVLKAMAEVQSNIGNDSTVVHEYPVISPWSIMKAHADARPGEYDYNATFIKLFKDSDTNHDGIPDKNISRLYSMLEPEISKVLKKNQAIFIIHTNSEDLKRVDKLDSELRYDAKPLKKYANVEIAGDAIVGQASINEINENQIRSLFLSITSAIAMLIILFKYTKKSITLGIIAAIPIMVVVTWNWLLMFILNISLNVMTNTIASLCVGLGVDYGIHITHRFVEESHRFYDLKKALFRSTERIGLGLMGAAATTISSIGILYFSSIPPLSNFALILSFSIFSAFIASILVLPSLLILWASFRRKHGYDRVAEETKIALKNGDKKVLCKYHVSKEACIEYVHELIQTGKVAEARNIIEKLKVEDIDLTNLLITNETVYPPYE